MAPLESIVFPPPPRRSSARLHKRGAEHCPSRASGLGLINSLTTADAFLAIVSKDASMRACLNDANGASWECLFDAIMNMLRLHGVLDGRSLRYLIKP
jgi:hypothetical protein